MHRVLQQNWIVGKSCLVEEEHREALLDILNLLSEKVDANGEAEELPEEKPEGHFEDLTENEQDEAAVESELILEETDSDEAAGAEIVEKEPEDQSEGEDVLQAAGVEEVQEEVIYKAEDDYGEIPIWYYCPNGSLIKR